MSILVEAQDPGKFFFDALQYGIEEAAMRNECRLHKRDDINDIVEVTDDFFEVSEPYVCEKKEYSPRKMTLREKILFGK